jgi:hypothetical protein
MATCRSCGAEVRWVITAGEGKEMPIDVVPVENGNLEVVGRAQNRYGAEVAKVACRNPGELSMLDGVRFVPHFATCPDAADWRRSEQKDLGRPR